MRKEIAPLVIALLLLVAGAATAQEWQVETTASGPGLRSSHSVTTVDGTVYLFGGVDGNNQRRNDLWRWDPDARTWVEIHAATPPSPRAGHVAVAADHELWILFGQDGTTNGSIWSYDPATNAWHDSTPAGTDLITRSAFGATVIRDDAGDDWIVFAGGFDVFVRLLPDVGILRVRDLHYETRPDLPHALWGLTLAPVVSASRRGRSSTEAPRADGVVVTGGLSDMGASANYAWMADVLGAHDTWKEFTPDFDPRINGPAVVPMDDGSIIRIGGRDADSVPVATVQSEKVTMPPGGGDPSLTTRPFPSFPEAVFDLGCALVAGQEIVCQGGRAVDFAQRDQTLTLPLPGMPSRPEQRWIVAANAEGVGTRWSTTTDFLRAYSLGEDGPEAITLRAHPMGAGPCTPPGAACPLEVSFDLGSGEGLHYEDILGDVFGTGGAAVVEIEADARTFDDVGIISRIASSDGTAGAPTHGQGFSPLTLADAATPESPKTLLGLRSNDAFRCNVAVYNLSPTLPSDVRVSLYEILDGQPGQEIGAMTFTLDPNGFRQVNDAFGAAGITDPVDDGYAVVSTSTPGAQVLTYASVIDNATQDPTTITPARLWAEPIIIPAIAKSQASLPEYEWRSRLDFFTSDENDVDVQFLRRDQDNSTPLSTTIHLAAGEVRGYDDVVADLFGLDAVAGALRLVAEKPLAATSRIYFVPGVARFSPSSGQGIPGLPDSQATTRERVAIVPGLSYSPDPTVGFHTNGGFSNPDLLHSVTLEVDVLDDGYGQIGTATVTLPPGGVHQINDIFRMFTDQPVDHGALFVRVASPDDGRFFCYGSKVDNQTGDATYIPGNPGK